MFYKGFLTSAVISRPIVVMIENYRTGLLWKLFMNIPDIQKACTVSDLLLLILKNKYGLLIIDENSKRDYQNNLVTLLNI